MVDTTAPQRTGPPPGAVVPRWVREALAGQSLALVLACRLHGEWFEPDAAMQAWLDGLAS